MTVSEPEADNANDTDVAAGARAVLWGLGVRPLLRARDLAVASRNGAIARAYRKLWRLERALPPHQASPRGVDDAERAGLSREALTWGETPLATAVDLLASAGVTSSSTVVDLGAGRGMVLLAARLLRANARGVELDPMRAEPAQPILTDVGGALSVGDARSYELAGATHVWLAWTCMPHDVRATLSERVAQLPAGTRVVALTWDPPSSSFEVIGRARARFSWGTATVITAERKRSRPAREPPDPQ